MSTIESQSLLKSLLFFCRIGYEHDLQLEIQSLLKSKKKLSPKIIFLKFEGALLVKDLPQELEGDLRDLVFAHSVLRLEAHLKDLPEKNKLEPILKVLSERKNKIEWHDFSVMAAHPNASEDLPKFCTKFSKVLEKKSAEFLMPHSNDIKKSSGKSENILNLIFLDYKNAVIVQTKSKAFIHPLKREMESDPKAPSKSWFKLVEAAHVFSLMADGTKKASLKPGMSVVDLGAAPGGWTYWLASKGMRVTAVDHGTLDRHVLSMPGVKYFSENAFHFKGASGRSRFDWLFCDMVEEPMLVLDLLLNWIKESRVQNLLFNLKLPHSKRFELLLQIRNKLNAVSGRSKNGSPLKISYRIKHLVHNRNELTLLVQVR